jgi:hypothetical protein
MKKTKKEREIENLYISINNQKYHNMKILSICGY